jgi:biopolymer transport protein ExbB
MSFDLRHIFEEMDWMARCVTITLIVMGLASLTVAIERVFVYLRSRRQSGALARAAAPLIASGTVVKLRDRLAAYPASHLARMLRPAVDILVRRRDGAAVELVRRELERQRDEASADLRRGLSLLASVGSVAPFVGLLGTVVGIIAAFNKISATGSGGLGSVAGGISEALVVTALGLVVAIPAVLLFNRLSGMADAIEQGLGNAAGQFVDAIEFSEERGGHGRHGETAPA